MTEKNKKYSNWIEFWNNLDYGPKGSLIALVVSFLILAGPLILRLFIYILIILVSMALGGLIGVLVGWIIKSYNFHKNIPHRTKKRKR